ncbi:MAG: hypothetical protein WBW31_20255, partial [Candidatus Sulfotelmatobacter sp.]
MHPLWRSSADSSERSGADVFGRDAAGTWNDSDGTARYACLYEPASASVSNPLPLLVWLHPSLVTADSITSTNLLSFQDD